MESSERSTVKQNILFYKWIFPFISHPTKREIKDNARTITPYSILSMDTHRKIEREREMGKKGY